VSTPVVNLRDYILKAQQPQLKQVTAYVDGACFSNPSRGGYGVLLKHGQHHRRISGLVPEEPTTNQRAELHAAMAALEALRVSCEVTIVTDSMYLVETANGNYKRHANLDLWEALYLAARRHRVTYEWRRGHNGDAGNEIAHQLAESVLRGGAA
jgi:ribonuclease HI